MEQPLAEEKLAYSDGEVIFYQGTPCNQSMVVLKGNIDLLIDSNGEYIHKKTLSKGETFGRKGGNYTFTSRANGYTEIKYLNLPTIPNKKNKPFNLPISRPYTNSSAEVPYSNLNLIRRLLNGLSASDNRICIRVAALTGENSTHHTRHVISTLGNDKYIQTRGITQSFSIDISDNIPNQLDRIFQTSRGILAYQKADILVWGNVSPSTNAIILRFIPLTMWDQQAPGSFNLETEITLPIDFGEDYANLLRVTAIAATMQSTSSKTLLSKRALKASLSKNFHALTEGSATLPQQQLSSIHSCYASALCISSLPQYDPNLLKLALEHFKIAINLINKNEHPNQYSHIQKHIGSILHIEADRNNNPQLLEEATTALQDSLDTLDEFRYPLAWGIIQNRLGLICYHQGFENGEASLLRDSINYYQASLQIYKRDTFPSRWAEVMSNFAQAIQVLGEHTQSHEALTKSANACIAILEVRSRKKTPKSWAATQNNLGSAMFLLGKRTRNLKKLNAAQTAFKLCMEVYNENHSEKLATITSNNLKRTNDLITHLEWENTLTTIYPKDPSGLPEPGEGLIKRTNRTRQPIFRATG